MAESKKFTKRTPISRRGQLSNAQYILTELLDSHNLLGEKIIGMLDVAEEEIQNSLNADRMDRKNARKAATKMGGKQ
jgi:hypothetical protein